MLKRKLKLKLKQNDNIYVIDHTLTLATIKTHFHTSVEELAGEFILLDETKNDIFAVRSGNEQVVSKSRGFTFHEIATVYIQTIVAFHEKHSSDSIPVATEAFESVSTAEAASAVAAEAKQEKDTKKEENCPLKGLFGRC